MVIVKAVKESGSSEPKELCIPESYFYYLLLKLSKEFGADKMKISVKHKDKNENFADIVILDTPKPEIC